MSQARLSKFTLEKKLKALAVTDYVAGGASVACVAVAD